MAAFVRADMSGAEMERLHHRIAALGVELPVAAPREIAALADLASAAIAASE